MSAAWKCPHCGHLYRRTERHKIFGELFSGTDVIFIGTSSQRLICIDCKTEIDYGQFQSGKYDVAGLQSREIENKARRSGCGLGLITGVVIFLVSIFFVHWVVSLLIALTISFIVSEFLWPKFAAPELKTLGMLDELQPLDDSVLRAKAAWTKLPANLHPLVEELIRIGRKAQPDWESSSYFLTRARPRSQQIGERLNEAGGLEMMIAAHEVVRSKLGAVAARELEGAWNSIGDWMS